MEANAEGLAELELETKKGANGPPDQHRVGGGGSGGANGPPDQHRVGGGGSGGSGGANGPPDQHQGGGDKGANGPQDQHLGGGGEEEGDGEDNGNFDGASGVSRRPPIKHHCDFCHDDYDFASWMCYVEKSPPHDFVKKLDQKVEEAKTGTFVRHFDTRATLYCCIHCKGRRDQTKYLQEHSKIPGKLVPTARWVKACNLSKGKVDKNSMNFLLNRLDKTRTSLNLQFSNSRAVWNAMLHQDFRQSTDWVQRIAPDAFCHHGCGECEKRPLQSCHWYRYCNTEVSESGRGFHDSKYCDWRKPC